MAEQRTENPRVGGSIPPLAIYPYDQGLTKIPSGKIVNSIISKRESSERSFSGWRSRVWAKNSNARHNKPPRQDALFQAIISKTYTDLDPSDGKDTDRARIMLGAGKEDVLLAGGLGRWPVRRLGHAKLGNHLTETQLRTMPWLMTLLS